MLSCFERAYNRAVSLVQVTCSPKRAAGITQAYTFTIVDKVGAQLNGCRTCKISVDGLGFRGYRILFVQETDFSTLSLEIIRTEIVCILT